MALKVGKVLPTIEDVDPFDKSAVSLSPGDRAASVAVKELVEVPVRRPSQEAFFRVHADDNYTTDIAILEPPSPIVAKGDQALSALHLHHSNRRRLPMAGPVAGGGRQGQ